MMPKILIVADDLSGAADCAVICATRGVETVVLIDAARVPQGAVAVAVDTNSRTMAPDEAGRAAARAIAHLQGRDTHVLYQKIDSTLRGNWAVEVVHARRAAVELRGAAPLAIVAPAFPGTGRTTLGGRVLVRNVPLEQTETWTREGLKGVADVPLCLGGAGLRVELATLSIVRAGPEDLHAQLLRWREDGIEAVVCDAESDDDLAVIAAASALLRGPVLHVGSAGLMRALAANLEPHGPVRTAPESIDVERPILTVVGSASQISHTQFEILASAPGVMALTVPPQVLRLGAETAEAREIGHALDRVLASGHDVALAIGHAPEVDLREGSRLAAELAALIAPRVSELGGLVMTGGETARAILIASGISGLRLRGEVEPGVPLGVGIGEHAVPVVTKAGAFGDRQTLLRCRAALRPGQGGPGVAVALSDRPGR
jgi:uncharacterized protein YgbK (DUF1537 family)